MESRLEPDLTGSEAAMTELCLRDAPLFPDTRKCLSDPSLKRLRPSATHFRAARKGVKWTSGEDSMLQQLVLSLESDWSQIARHFPGLPKSAVRRRWENLFDPRMKKTPWTLEEDAQVLSLLEKYGSKWKKIAKCMEGRPADHIKNRYYGHIKKCKSQTRGEELVEVRSEPNWENTDIFFAKSAAKEEETDMTASKSTGSILAILKTSVAQLETELLEVKLKMRALDIELAKRTEKSI